MTDFPGQTTEATLLDLLSGTGPDTSRTPPSYGPLVPEYEPVVNIRRREKDSVPPLFCTLHRKANGTRYVTVSEGRVSEIIPKMADADDDGDAEDEADDGVLEHKIQNIWDLATPNLLREHGPIAEGEVVGVAFDVDVNGYIAADSCVIEVRPYAERFSKHFTPEVGASPGAVGDNFHVLARLIGTGDAEKLEIWHSGSNIDYYHDTPPFQLAEGATGVGIFKQYNLKRGLYEYFGLLGIAPIQIAMGGANVDDIEVSWIGTRDLDLIVKKRVLVNDGPTEIEVPINIYGVTLTGSITGTGEHVHTVTGAISPESEHTHPIPRHDHIYYDGSSEDRTSEGLLYETLTPLGDTGAGSAHDHLFSSGATGTGEGTHDHEVTVTGDISTTATISVPSLSYFKTVSSYFTLCWRAGIYVGVFDDGAALPAPSGNGLDTRTIYVLNDDTGSLTPLLLTTPTP